MLSTDGLYTLRCIALWTVPGGRGGGKYGGDGGMAGRAESGGGQVLISFSSALVRWQADFAGSKALLSPRLVTAGSQLLKRGPMRLGRKRYIDAVSRWGGVLGAAESQSAVCMRLGDGCSLVSGEYS